MTILMTSRPNRLSDGSDCRSSLSRHWRLLGSAAGFLWRSYGGDLPAFLTFSSISGPAAQSVDKVAGLVELQALQQQSVGQMQTVLQLLTSPHAEIKKLAHHCPLPSK